MPVFREKKNIQIDDLLLELVDRDRQKASRRGIYATFTALGLLLILFAAIGDFLAIENRHAEADSLASIGNSIAYNVERRLSNAAAEVAGIGNARSSFCESSASVFPLFWEILEISLIDSDGMVIASCPNPSVMGDITRHPGRTIRPDATVSAIGYARSTSKSVYTRPYQRGNVATGPFSDLIVPFPGGPDIVARISLGSLIRLTDAQSASNLRDVQLAVDGRPFPETVLKTSRLSIVTEQPLPPLPAGTGIIIRSTRLSFFYEHGAFIWGILALASLVIIAVVFLLRFQYRQVSTELTLSSRNLVQQAMSRSFIDGLLVRNRQGKILFANEPLEKLFGIPARKLLGMMPPFPFRHPDNDPDVLDRLNHLEDLDSQDSGRVVFRARHSSGRELLCLTETRPLLGSGGEHIGWLSTFRDVTEEYRARKELDEIHERVNLVLDVMDASVSVVSLDEPRQLLYANTGYVDVFGGSPQPHLRLIAINGGKDVTRGTKGEIFDEATGRWLLVRSKIISWVDGNRAEMMTASDITEKHLGEEALENQRKAAENSSRLITIGETASSLAHELNQPLAAVQNYASAALTLLDNERLTDKSAREALDKIIAQTQRAAGIMRRIRRIARRGEAVITPTAVSSLVEETMELAQLVAKQMNIHVALEIEPGLPDVDCDPIMTEQLLLNLLKNAMEASAESTTGTVTLCVSRHAGRIRFSVIDNGSGISPEIRDKLFQPFFTTKPAGTGIGLNICRSIAEIHHSRLVIEENPAGGSIFSFSFPISRNGCPK